MMTSSSRRFLMVSMAEFLPWAGSEVLWAEVARQLVHQGHKVSFSYQFWPEKPQFLKDLEAAGVQGVYRGDPADVGVLKSVKRRWDWWRRSPCFATAPRHWLLSLVETLSPDLIVLNLCDAYQIADLYEPVCFFRRHGLPYYVICQLESEFMMLVPSKRERLREIYAGACGVAFGSERGAEVVSRQLALQLPRVEIFDNPPNTSHQMLPWPEHKELRLACVGRLDVGAKGHDLLLAALSGAAWKDRCWRLSFYGVGQDESYLRQLIRHYQLSDKVTLAGFVPSTDEIWRHEHVCLQPSPKEGTPLTVVEALFAGRPCLVSDRARMPQLVRQGKSGWIVFPAVDSILSGLEEVWQAKETLSLMGQSAHAFIHDYWRMNYPAQMAELLLGLTKA